MTGPREHRAHLLVLEQGLRCVVFDRHGRPCRFQIRREDRRLSSPTGKHVVVIEERDA